MRYALSVMTGRGGGGREGAAAAEAVAELPAVGVVVAVVLRRRWNLSAAASTREPSIRRLSVIVVCSTPNRTPKFGLAKVAGPAVATAADALEVRRCD